MKTIGYGARTPLHMFSDLPGPSAIAMKILALEAYVFHEMKKLLFCRLHLPNSTRHTELRSTAIMLDKHQLFWRRHKISTRRFIPALHEETKHKKAILAAVRIYLKNCCKGEFMYRHVASLASSEVKRELSSQILGGRCPSCYCVHKQHLLS